VTGPPEPHPVQLASPLPDDVDWRRNLYVIWIAEFVSIVGFSAAMPFLPYYVQELGITAPGEVELWSGLLHSMHALAMGVMAPVWGSLADRVGHKAMVGRAMFGGALLLAAMAFVGNVQQLLILRTVQGAVTGTVVASTALVAAGTPVDQRGVALGALQMGIYLGASFGPVVGGFIADAYGYRVPFVITGISLALSGVLVALQVREARAPRDVGSPVSFVDGMRAVTGSTQVLQVFGVRLLVRSAFRSVAPLLPLFIQMLAPTEERLSSVVGLVTGAAMVASAVGAATVGRFGARFGLRRVLTACAATSAATYLLQSMATGVLQLLLLRSLSGLAMGGILTALSSALASASPKGYEGAVFGVDSSVVSVANAIGPMAGGAIAASWGLRTSFAVAAGGFALTVVLLLAQHAPTGVLAIRSLRKRAE
jgi:DHA1 family multidrug resistance protein-like MFS transporter